MTGRVPAAALAALLLTGCVSPSRTDDDYAHKAANTAEAVASSVNTAVLAVQAAYDGKVFAPYLSRLLAEAEEDANAAAQTLDSVQPPSRRADLMYAHLSGLVDGATYLLRELRVAVRRGDVAGLRRIAGPLPGIARALRHFESDPE
jgi:hypothetical protein